MTAQVRFRRGTAAQNASFTGADSEVTVVTDDHSLRVHDGVTAGGFQIGYRFITAAQLTDANSASPSSAGQALLAATNVTYLTGNAAYTSNGQKIRRVAQLQTDRGREYAITKRTIALREWFRALSARNTAPAVVFGIGDSIFEGRQATSYLSRQIAQLALNLSQAYPTAGVTRSALWPGYVEAAMSFSPQPTDFPVTYSGSVTKDVVSPKGFGARSITLATGFTLTIVAPAGSTGVECWFYKGFGTRTWGWSIDGGSVTNVDASNVSLNVVDAVMSRIPLPDALGHTVVIHGVSASACGFDGFFVNFGDESKGVKCYLGGRASVSSALFSNAVASQGTAEYVGQQVAALQPSLVLIELGANDFQQASLQVSAAQFKTSMQSIIANIRANATRPPSIVINCVWTWTPGAAPVETGGWAAFVDAMYSIAEADDDICVLDDQQRMTLSTTSDTTTLARGLIGADGIHPSDAGYWMLAQAKAKFLQP